MPNYRRDYSYSTWFFTVVIYNRMPILTTEKSRKILRSAISACRLSYPFAIDAWVLLPDHLHCIWTFPEADKDYSRRWGFIKRKFTQSFRNIQNISPPFWQKRFWAHAILDDADFEDHMNYIHYNPVKHGHVKRPIDWDWTSFHRLIKSGIYPSDWGGDVKIAKTIGHE